MSSQSMFTSLHTSQSRVFQTPASWAFDGYITSHVHRLGLTQMHGTEPSGDHVLFMQYYGQYQGVRGEYYGQYYVLHTQLIACIKYMKSRRSLMTVTTVIMCLRYQHWSIQLYPHGAQQIPPLLRHKVHTSTMILKHRHIHSCNPNVFIDMK
eukprot:224440_1